MSHHEIKTNIIGTCAECGADVHQEITSGGTIRMGIHSSSPIDMPLRPMPTAKDMQQAVSNIYGANKPNNLNKVADDIATAVNAQPKNDSEQIIELLGLILLELKKVSTDKENQRKGTLQG